MTRRTLQEVAAVALLIISAIAIALTVAAWLTAPLPA